MLKIHGHGMTSNLAQRRKGAKKTKNRKKQVVFFAPLRLCVFARDFWTHETRKQHRKEIPVILFRVPSVAGIFRHSKRRRPRRNDSRDAGMANPAALECRRRR